MVELDTAYNNKNAIRIYEHMGFIKVDFKVYKGLDHYSVFMVKWFEERPFSKFYCYLRYSLKKTYIMFRFKVGGIKRFI